MSQPTPQSIAQAALAEADLAPAAAASAPPALAPLAQASLSHATLGPAPPNGFPHPPNQKQGSRSYKSPYESSPPAKDAAKQLYAGQYNVGPVVNAGRGGQNPWAQAPPSVYQPPQPTPPFRSPNLSGTHPIQYAQGQKKFGEAKIKNQFRGTGYSQKAFQTSDPAAPEVHEVTVPLYSVQAARTYNPASNITSFVAPTPSQVVQPYYAAQPYHGAPRTYAQASYTGSYVAPDPPQAAQPYHSARPSVGQASFIRSYTTPTQVRAQPYHTALPSGHKIRPSTALPHNPISVVSSLPGYNAKALDESGNLREARTITQGVFSTVASADSCIVCKVVFGQASPHGAYFENVRELDGNISRVEINNFGAAETRVYLPCGHDIGNNCIVAYSFCPRCRSSLHYADCSHKIPLTTFKATMKNTHQKCSECRIVDHEHKENLSGLLAELGRMKAERERLHKEMEQDRAFDHHQFDIAVTNLQQKADAIKAATNLMIQEAEYKASGYN